MGGFTPLDFAGGAVAALMIWAPMWWGANAPRPAAPALVQPAAMAPATPESSDAAAAPGAVDSAAPMPGSQTPPDAGAAPATPAPTPP